jgi:hypothetical protein
MKEAVLEWRITGLLAFCTSCNICMLLEDDDAHLLGGCCVVRSRVVSTSLEVWRSTAAFA